MAKWTTWIGESTLPPAGNPVHTGPAPERTPVTYGSYDEIPAAVRESLCAAHESGLSVEQLQKIFELPAAWIARAVRAL
jgi:hypothetical protein